jgi:hypothetical protein
MQKWEYLFVLRDREYDSNHKIGEWNVSFIPPQGRTGNKPSEFLPALGEQGWELVSVWPLSDISGDGWAGYTSVEKWVFKRPKPE